MVSKGPTPKDPWPEQTTHLSDEALSRFRWRYTEARRMGMAPFDAKAFAASNIDIEEMRDMLGRGCTADLFFSIVL